MCTAPTGFGKSVLAQQARDRASELGAVRTVGPSNLDAIQGAITELNGEQRAILIVDDAGTETLDWLSQAELGDGTTVLCLGRFFEPRLLRTPRVTVLTEADLKFDLPQISELARAKMGEALDATTAQALATTGWPEHVDLVVTAIASRRSRSSQRDIVDEGHHLDNLIGRCLAGFSDAQLEGLGQLAHLGVFSEAAANAFVPGLMDAGRAVGFPFLAGEGNSIAMPTLIRDHVKQGSAFSDESASILAPLLVATLGTATTLKALLAVRATEQAADVVTAVPPDQLSATDQTEMLGILRAIEAAEPDRPIITLRRAGVHRNLAQLEAEQQAVERVINRATALDLADLVLAGQLALLRIELRTLDPDDAQSRLNELAKTSETLSPSRTTAAAIREIQAMVLAQRPDLPSIYRSIELFRELAAEWEFMGDRLRSAWLLRMLAAGPLDHTGKYVEGRELLDRAVPLVKENPLSMAATAGLLCRFLALSGDSDRLPSQVATSQSLISDVGLTWMAGYLDWSVMLSCLYDRDADEAERAFRRALSKLGEVAKGDTGTVFYAEAASVFSVLGSEQLAEQCLASAKNGGNNWLETSIAEVIFHARCGDASAVPALVAQLLRSDGLPSERAWRVELEGIVASDRLGDPAPERESTLARIEGSCRELGLSTLFDALRGQFEPTNRPESPDVSQDDVHISLLGDFTVQAQGETLAVPPGHVSQLLKFLAVRGEPLSVEFVVSRLWPDAELSVGKRRLKNVTSRLRNLTKAPIVVRNGDRIWLSESVTSDLALFREAANTAVRPTDAGKRLSSCVEALNLYRGHLLPTDLYDDDFTRERDALRAVALSVLDLAIEYADHRTVEPAWVLQVAIRIEPHSEAPFLQIARIADAIGAHECAAAANSQAQSIAADLGFG